MSRSVSVESAGVSVYGVPQVAFSMEGEHGLDFGTVVARVTLNQAAIADSMTAAATSALQLRQHQVVLLGNTLAKVDSVLGRFKQETQRSSDKIKFEKNEWDELLNLQKELKKYGYTLDISHEDEQEKCCAKDVPESWAITRATAMKAQSDVQAMIDTENNNLQQDMISVQGFQQKRDKAFESAGDMVNKFNSTAGTIIQRIN